MSVAAATGVRRVRARVEGTVQGVGFRPYVFRLAAELELSGFVLNDERGVLLEAEGAEEAVVRFLERLPDEAPPLARVERLTVSQAPATGAPGFAIVESERSGEPEALVSPDSATCPDCLAELLDPADRRFRYPFINCTNCGPRFTIIRDVPYDRPLTTMAGFEMCARCRAEYEDPLDRRFHAQPNACPDCGPTVELVDANGREVESPGGVDAIRSAADALASGSVLAVKGLGGFHLACRADDERAVATLRARKHREEKPFALMVPGVEAAHALALLSGEDEALLLERSRPIVLARRRPDALVAPSVAPRSPDLGLMLPYSPLHHLLLGDARAALVMTSGNISDEPIAYRDEEALERLAGIADMFLLHDRPIHMRTDDSVVRTVSLGDGRRTLVARRSRGYVPESLVLPVAASAGILACGAELKSTFCLAKGRRAWVGHHIGDLSNYETLRSFREGIEHFERLFAVTPGTVAHDLHPEYLATKHALERDGCELVGVQHHHAHLAACLAEHGELGPAVGAIFDGTGFGLDETIWGGELLVGGLEGFERVGHLRPVRMPGGQRAISEPWRMACAWLTDACGRAPELPPGLIGHVAEQRWHEVARLALSGLASPTTTSMGRLFDAIAALCGIRTTVSYEGQAAIELEAQAWRAPAELPYALPVLERDGAPLVLDARPTIIAALEDVSAGRDPAVVAGRFHEALACATAESCTRIAGAHGIGTVVLSGGVFQNRLLLERTAALLVTAGLRVLAPELLPPNDGGISYGQAAVAAASAGR